MTNHDYHPASDTAPQPTIPDDIAAAGGYEGSQAVADNCTLYPAGDRLIIRRDEAAGSSRGGILLPDNARDNRTTRGTVLAVGPGKWAGKWAETYDPAGNVTGSVPVYSPMPYHVGDVVLFGKYAGHEMEVNGQEYLILTADDIMVKAVPSDPASAPTGG